MATPASIAKKVREIYLSLPDTQETPTWGSPHFRVNDKIFGGFDQEAGVTTIGFKLEMDHAAAMIASDPRFQRAPYVGHKGWVKMDVSHVDDWEEVRTLVHESYRLIAPKRSVAKLEPATVSAPKRPTAGKKAAKKTGVKTAAKKEPAARKSAR